MIWLNPWGWLGLATLALPVLIHLLARGHARVHRFPSLRFIAPSQLLPTRRTRVHDWLLLLVRCGILAAAVAALARPLLLTGARTAGTNELARAIIVDTSASMLRASPDGRAIDVARREAQRLAAESQSSVVLETPAPRQAMDGALAWIARQNGRRELVIISDLQRGSLSSHDLARVPTDVGIHVTRVRVAAGDSVVVARLGAGMTRTAHRGAETTIEWRDTLATGSGIGLLAGESEQEGVNAMTKAVRATNALSRGDAAHPISVVFPGYDGRAALLSRATPPTEPWMVDAVARLRADSLVIAAASTVARLAPGDSANGIVVATAADGKRLVVAAQRRERLLLFASSTPGSLVSAALVSAASRIGTPPIDELDPVTLGDDEVARMQRAPSERMSRAADRAGLSDGRWLWIVALVLLVVEMRLRRSLPAPKVQEEVHDRAA
jgi:hypothetical protein